jgi:hypothetical protein
MDEKASGYITLAIVGRCGCAGHDSPPQETEWRRLLSYNRCALDRKLQERLRVQAVPGQEAQRIADAIVEQAIELLARSDAILDDGGEEFLAWLKES